MSNSASSLKRVAAKLATGIRLSTALESKDIKFYSSVDQQVSDESDNVNKKILSLLDTLVGSVNSIVPDSDYDGKNTLLNKDATETEKWKAVSNSLESLFENTEISLDDYQRQKKKGSQASQKQQNSADSNHNEHAGGDYTYLDESDRNGNSSNNNNRRPQPSLKISKPQLKFEPPIDNNIEASSPFKPLITTKPNAIKSFQESMALIPDDLENGFPIHYENPYSYEIMNQEYPEWVIDPHRDNSDDFKSIPWNESKEPIIINHPNQLPELLTDMSQSKVIAIDLEHHDYRTYHGLTCLMQITTESHTDYLIDTLSPELLPHLSQLNIIFTDPNIVKVLHGAQSDIIWLQRDLGLYIVSLFDTYYASKELNLGKYSLAYLLEKYVHFITSKKWQLADWRQRPLPEEMQLYAKADTHFLIEVFYKLRKELVKIPGKIQLVLRDSRKVANKRFEYSTFKPLIQTPDVTSTFGSVSQNPEVLNQNISLSSTSFKSSSLYPWNQLAASNGMPQIKIPLLEVLYKWRDTKARQEDESIRYIMSDFNLVSLVTKVDINMIDSIDENQILDIINTSSRFGGSLYVKSCIKQLTVLIKNCLIEIKNSDLESWDKAENLQNNSHNDDASLYDKIVDVKAFENDFEKLNQLYNTNYVNQNDGTTIVQRVSLSDSTRNKNGQISKTFGVEYKTPKKAFYSDDSVINERKQFALKKFENMEQEIKMNLPDEEPQVVEETPVKEEEAKQQEQEQQPKRDRNEIVTLRKHNRNQQSKKEQPERPKDEEVDYLDLTSKKIITEAKPDNRKQKDQDKNKNKKRSFDPYAGLDDDKGKKLKKKKLVTQGKNVTFTKRR